MPMPQSEASPRGELPDVRRSDRAALHAEAEAKQVGLVDEAAVDWSAAMATSTSTSASRAAARTGLAVARRSRSTRRRPASSDRRRPSSASRPSRTAAPQLIDHIQLGFAYQMHLKNEWQKVRLAHVSSGRSFFLFTRGAKHQETISMTSRMLARMCETGRLRAVESAYLMERATHRARKQLAALKTPTRH